MGTIGKHILTTYYWIDDVARWDHLRAIGNSRLVKLTILVPLLGYLILFNESFVQYLELSRIYFLHASPENVDTGSASLSLSATYRLYCLYFGFTFLAFGSLIYEFCCPTYLKAYGSAYEFYRAEGAITNTSRLNQFALALLKPRFESDCAKLGLTVEDVWLNRKFAQMGGLQEEQEGRHLRNQMTQFIQSKAQGTENEKAYIMTGYFVPLKSAKPRLRWTVLFFYALGFATLGVPAIISFVQIVTGLIAKF